MPLSAPATDLVSASCLKTASAAENASIAVGETTLVAVGVAEVPHGGRPLVLVCPGQRRSRLPGSACVTASS